MWIAIIGIALEILGFIFIIRSTPRLVLRPGGFTADHYVNPKNQPTPARNRRPARPPHISSWHNHGHDRPGLADCRHCYDSTLQNRYLIETSAANNMIAAATFL
jgi:hypothetical protein